MRHIKFALKSMLFGLSATAVLAMGPALAADPKPLGTYKDWKAFSMRENNSTVCYVVSTPKDKNPKNVRRGDVFFVVTTWGQGKFEPSVITGYPYKKNSKSAVKVGSDKFELFTQGDGAWLYDAKEETRIIRAMKRGSSMIVTGTSQRGTLTTDRYSLSGVTAALDKAKKTCN